MLNINFVLCMLNFHTCKLSYELMSIFYNIKFCTSQQLYFVISVMGGTIFGLLLDTCGSCH